MKRSQLFTFFLTLLPHDRTGQSASLIATDLKPHTKRSCSVWPGVSTKSAVAPTNFISRAGHNLAVSWKTGFRPNVSSRLSSAPQSGLTLSPALLHNWSIETIVEEQKQHDDHFSDRRQHTSGPVF